MKRAARWIQTSLVCAALCLCTVTWNTLADAPVTGDVRPVPTAKQEMVVFNAAAAARMLRFAEDPNGNGRRMQWDLTQNGLLDATDARAALWVATGRIPDVVKFVERIATGLCNESLFHRFRYDGVTDDRNGNYQSANVSVEIREGSYDGDVYFLADICIQDLRSLKTALAGGKYGGAPSSIHTMVTDTNAIVAINGDYYTHRRYGPMVRNGVTYRMEKSRTWDLCVLTYDGQLHTIQFDSYTADSIAALRPYQTWLFGPRLIADDGTAMTTFRSQVTPTNPRTVLGYYEPGHYAFLLVDGRQNDYSDGLNMQQLSKLCVELGFAAAYNLDGGRSSVMAGQSGFINKPFLNGRSITDIVYITDLPDA